MTGILVVLRIHASTRQMAQGCVKCSDWRRNRAGCC